MRLLNFTDSTLALESRDRDTENSEEKESTVGVSYWGLENGENAK